MSSREARVAVVVIGRDEGPNVDLALTSVIRAREAGEPIAEILYVDSASRDDSLERASNFPGVRCLALAPDEAGAARAREAGWRAARSPLVQFLDADMTLERGWIPAGAHALQARGLAAVCGRLTERHLDATPWNLAFGLDWDSTPGPTESLGGAALWQRSALEDAGGFDPRLRVGEDPDLAIRAVSAGCALERLDVPMATHDLALGDFAAYWKRALAVGESVGNVVLKHGLRVRGRKLVEGAQALLFVILFVGALAASTASVAVGLTATLAALVFRKWTLGWRRGLAWKRALVHAAHVYAVRLPVALGFFRASVRRAPPVRSAPTGGPIAYLAPEIPSISATFVFREILALRHLGRNVIAFSLRRPDVGSLSEDGKPFLRETPILYGRPTSILVGALAQIARRPSSSVRCLRIAVRDTLLGEFSRPAQRAKVLLQAVAGLHLARCLARRGAVHLHVHFANAPATVGMYAGIASGLPFTVTAHANDLFVEGALLREKIERAHRFFTISRANQQWLRERLGDSAKNVELMRCGVDLEEFSYRAPRPLPPTPVVFAVGRLVPKKGFDVLLDAAARIHELRVVIAGDGPERESLQKRAARPDLANRVDFLGAVDRRRIVEGLRACDLFALPSRRGPDGDRDGIPVCLMEAMASGVPVIATAISGIPELVEHHRTGLLASAGDPESLAGVLQEALASPERLREYAVAARELVEREFDQHSNARLLAGRMSHPVSERPERRVYRSGSNEEHSGPASGSRRLSGAGTAAG